MDSYFCGGELAEWSIAAVLKTVDCYRSAGSNPPLSAKVSKPFKKPGIVRFQASCFGCNLSYELDNQNRALFGFQNCSW